MQNFLRNPEMRAGQPRHRRGFSTIAALMLSLGVGVTTAAFSLVEGVVPHGAPAVGCETMMEYTSDHSGTANAMMAELPPSVELGDRLSSAYETSYESAGDAVESWSDISSDLGTRSVPVLFGAMALVLLVACTRGAARLLDSTRTPILVASASLGALSVAALVLRLAGLPMVGFREVTFGVCVSLLAVYAVRVAHRLAESPTS